jgi:hypothetical protein
MPAKYRLLRALCERGLRREDIVELYQVLDWLLPPELDRALVLMLEQAEGKDHMPYVTSAERLGHERGLVEGHEKGLVEGHEKGLVEGHEHALVALLTARFGPLPEDARGPIRAAAAAPAFDEVIRDAALAPSLAAFLERLRERR